MRKKRILYIISGLFAIWVIGLVISLMTGAVKIKFNEGGDKPDLSKKTDDGPYLILKNGDGFLGYFKNGKSIVERKPQREFINKSLQVINENPIDNFNVVIKSNIDIQPEFYPAAKKILAISDIEGNFYALKKILQDNGVIDDSLKWKYGNNDLVIIGDLLDRGLEVTQCLWLIYNLEDEAKKAGGHVHYILGNHETMVMAGDVRYVRKKYIELSHAMHLDYSNEIFGANSEIGRWLRSKNIAEKIGNTLFVHAGISENILEQKLTLKDINLIGRQYYGLSKDSISESPLAKEIFGKKGPLWYRGIPEEKLSSTEVTDILKFYSVDKIVFGHSIVKNIQGFYDGKLIGIDLEQPTRGSGSNTRALIIENNQFYEVTGKSNKRLIDEK